MLDRPIVLAVVGHVNAGKTSVIRTLARTGEFGDVDDAPGTTKTVVSVQRRFKDSVAVRLDDTPGLEDPVALQEVIQAIPQGLGALDRIRAFLRRPEASAEFAPEAKALRAILDADAIVYVVDTREAVLPKFHCEASLLATTAKPLVCVLNHLHSPDSRLAQWSAALSEHGIQAQIGLDAAAPEPAALSLFYRSLGAALATRRPEAGTLEAAAQGEAAIRRQEGVKSIATCLVSLAAMRRTLSRAEITDEAQRATRIDEIRREVVKQARFAHDALVQVHGFGVGDVEMPSLPGLSGRWEDDLFSPEALKISAEKFGTGAAIGAAIGLGLDIALAGLSLGVGTAIGAAIGGTAGQGFAPMGRALANKVTGQQDVSVEDPVLLLLGDRLLLLEAALSERGHGAAGPLATGSGVALHETSAKVMSEALTPARSHADWAIGQERSESVNARRERCIAELAAVLEKVPTNRSLVFDGVQR